MMLGWFHSKHLDFLDGCSNFKQETETQRNDLLGGGGVGGGGQDSYQHSVTSIDRTYYGNTTTT